MKNERQVKKRSKGERVEQRKKKQIKISERKSTRTKEVCSEAKQLSENVRNKDWKTRKSKSLQAERSNLTFLKKKSLLLTNFGDFQILAKNWQIYKFFGILTNFDKFLEF